MSIFLIFSSATVTSADYTADRVEGILVVSEAMSSVEQQFIELQNDITRSLSIRKNSYVYDENQIWDIINHSQLDWDELSDKLGIVYSPESFFRQAILRIRNTILDNSPATYGTYCGRNARTLGWNYDRWFSSQRLTTAWANDLEVRSEWQGYGGIVLDLASFATGNWLSGTAGFFLVSMDSGRVALLGR